MNEGLNYTFELEGVDVSHLNSVAFSIMPYWLQKIVNSIHQLQKCHSNSLSVFRQLASSGFQGMDQIKYVLGYITADNVVEHAFIRIGDCFYDPTLSHEQLAGFDIYSFLELDLTEVNDICQTRDDEEIVIHEVIKLPNYIHYKHKPKISGVVKALAESINTVLEVDNTIKP
ncbi:MAG: hypothetical protein HAW67_07005 [Endozoicomonadaceae bacterium]|nr:hypothetical protein [Endozoicomonadaceae bacterium]